MAFDTAPHSKPNLSDRNGDEPACWAAVGSSALHWAHWETDTSLFNAYTGETHLLSELPATALRALCEHCWPFDALCAHLALLCDTDNDANWQDKIDGLLDGLADLELVERRAADATDGTSATSITAHRYASR